MVAESLLGAGAAVSLAAPSYRIVRTFDELLASLAGERALICVDIPIGLASGQPLDDGVRRADLAARAFLGSRRQSSVFLAPCRPTLDAPDYAAACAAEFAARGKRISKQLFHIIPKIREVDHAISPAHQLPIDQAVGVLVREVHPEVAFAMLRGDGQPGCGLASSKRTREGEDERLALLRSYFSEVNPADIRASLLPVSHARPGLPAQPGGDGRPSRIVGRDDIVDALACLVVASRIVAGAARTFPDGVPHCDVRGLRMEIVG
jgi:predicted RNase H-like nuclease